MIDSIRVKLVRLFWPAVLRRGRERAYRRAARWLKYAHWSTTVARVALNTPTSALRAFFDGRTEGPGIWKWNHYFDIYERHLAKFRNTDVGILEIGIYSGGSLDMWQDYFGEKCRVYGVDLMPECKTYEREGVTIFIGDQADTTFWQSVKQRAPQLDIVIDDGGHLPNQQMVTLEELLPYLRPGGVYICEDVHGNTNTFASYVHRMARELNAYNDVVHNMGNPERRTACKATELQSAVASIHFYPFVVVIERTSAPITELVTPKHGTEWQPFLK